MPTASTRPIARYQQRFLAAGRITGAARVLDVGCGCGETTLDAARLAPDGFVLGVDLSSAMLRVARQRAARAGVQNVAFEQADAQVHPFPEASDDLALSRTSAMFFADKTAAFTNIDRALRPGGHHALLAWQPAHANEWIREITGALAAGHDLPPPPPEGPQPLSMGDPDRVRPG